ncbi:ATP-dependent DNA ligase [Spinellus fusiger]|nr:ATP-dependent DNA ligase [Spinellus fusiger]
MCVNKLCPDYEGLELGIGESFLIKTIVNNTGRTTQNVKADYKRVGDLGTVALTSKSSQKTLAPIKPLMVRHVFEVLKEIASISGTQSQSKKSNKMTALFVQCKGTEAKYLIRQLQGKLRIGLAEQTVLSALAQAAVSTAKLSAEQKEALLVNASIVVKSVYNQLPNYDMIVPALLKYSLEDFPAKCIMNPGIPLKPMLAHPTKSLTEVLDRFEGKSFTCEYKYDGERAQIHRLPNGETRVYSRNSENMSERYPDIIFILDCEVVAWDTTTKKILPFQVLSTRKRKNVVEEDIKVQVVIFAFDCLYLNEKSLLKESLKARREVLCSSFQETDDEFYFATHMDSHNIDDIQTFLDQSIVENCEGLMVKTFDGAEATYEPSRRSRNWLKVKKDYLNGIGDSMDLVVIGAYYGRGKRTSVYGAFLLACVDSESEDEFETICKIGTGFSDEALLKFHNELKQHVTERLPRGYRVGDNSMAPDVWFHPVQVWEVLCADLSISPRYTAALGKVDESRGISLRFPRFIRVREDKNPEQATTNEEVMHFYESQASTSKAQGGSEFDY